MMCRPDNSDTVAVDGSMVLGLRRWPIHFLPGMCRTSFIVKCYSKMFVFFFFLRILDYRSGSLCTVVCNRLSATAIFVLHSRITPAELVARWRYLTNVTCDAPMVTSEGSGFVHAIWCPYIVSAHSRKWRSMQKEENKERRFLFCISPRVVSSAVLGLLPLSLASVTSFPRAQSPSPVYQKTLSWYPTATL